MQSERPAILVLGAYRQTLAVLRSLAAQYELILGTDSPDSFVARSKHAHSLWHHPSLINVADFLTSLDELLSANRNIRVLFPVGDREILLLNQHRAGLPHWVQCAMPSDHVIQVSQQKAAMFHLVEHLGVPVASYRRVANGYQQLTAVATEIGYPCIVKAESETHRVFGEKAFIAKNPTTLEHKLATSLDTESGNPSALIVQKYCTGARRNVYFFADQGVVQASVEVAIDRTDQWDGTGYAVEGHTVRPAEEWNGHLKRLTRCLDYQGAGCLQYLVDSTTGATTFLEINARLGANFACALDSGLNLPLWWVQQCERTAAKENPTDGLHPHRFTYKPGRRYTWLYGDLRGLRKAIAAKQLTSRQCFRWLRSMLLANLRSRTHITFRISDPLPTMALYKWLLGGMARQLSAVLLGGNAPDPSPAVPVDKLQTPDTEDKTG